MTIFANSYFSLRDLDTAINWFQIVAMDSLDVIISCFYR